MAALDFFLMPSTALRTRVVLATNKETLEFDDVQQTCEAICDLRSITAFVCHIVKKRPMTDKKVSDVSERTK